MFPQTECEYHDMDILEELIEARMNNFKKAVDLTKKPLKIENKAMLSEKFFAIYSKKPKKGIPALCTTERCYVINTFHQIGWADPLHPDMEAQAQMTVDDLNLASRVEDLVYDRALFDERFPPFIIYIPNDKLLIKMIQACIGVKDPLDLWINLE